MLKAEYLRKFHLHLPMNFEISPQNENNILMSSNVDVKPKMGHFVWVCAYWPAVFLSVCPQIRGFEGIEYVEEDGLVRTQAVTWGLDRVDQRYLPLDGSYNPSGKQRQPLASRVADRSCPREPKSEEPNQTDSAWLEV